MGTHMPCSCVANATGDLVVRADHINVITSLCSFQRLEVFVRMWICHMHLVGLVSSQVPFQCVVPHAVWSSGVSVALLLDLLGSVVLGEVYAATCNECMINSASGDFVCIFCR